DRRRPDLGAGDVAEVQGLERAGHGNDGAVAEVVRGDGGLLRPLAPGPNISAVDQIVDDQLAELPSQDDSVAVKIHLRRHDLADRPACDRADGNGAVAASPRDLDDEFAGGAGAAADDVLN